MLGDLPADLLEELRIAAGCDYISELPDLRYGRSLLKYLATVYGVNIKYTAPDGKKKS